MPRKKRKSVGVSAADALRMLAARRQAAVRDLIYAGPAIMRGAEYWAATERRRYSRSQPNEMFIDPFRLAWEDSLRLWRGWQARRASAPGA